MKTHQLIMNIKLSYLHIMSINILTVFASNIMIMKRSIHCDSCHESIIEKAKYTIDHLHYVYKLQ